MAQGLGRAQELDDLRDASRLDEILQHRAVLAAQLGGLLGGFAVGHGVGFDPQGAADVCLPAAQARAVLAADHERLGAGRELGGVAQAGDGADLAEMAVDPGHEQDQAGALAGSFDGGLLAVAFHGQRDCHVGQDDHVVHGEDGEQFGLRGFHM